MWKGMAGLFIVCGAVAVLIMLFSKIMTKKDT
jgi:Mg2+/Co2+ transporter CorB